MDEIYKFLNGRIAIDVKRSGDRVVEIVLKGSIPVQNLRHILLICQDQDLIYRTDDIGRLWIYTTK